MRIEIPELKRCCCCVPLRRGLLFWVYLKLLVLLLLLLYLVSNLITILEYWELKAFAVVTTALVMFLIEVVFCVLFLFSAHRKSHEHMRIHYRYAIGVLILEIVIIVGFIGLTIYIACLMKIFTLLILPIILEVTCFIFVLIVLQAYFIILVRSEVLKLERGTTFRFINHTTESECKAEIIP